MINLAEKYAKQIATVFTRGSLVQTNTNRDYSFAGVKSITVMTPLTQDLVDYKRSGTQRYGEPKEMQDTVQEMTMTQDKAFSLIIDKGNLRDQENQKQAGRMLSQEIREKVTPLVDKYTIGRWAQQAGNVVPTASLSKTNIMETLSNAAAALDDLLVPADGRMIYVGAQTYKLMRMSADFLAVDSLAAKALTKGKVGEVMDMSVIKVPTTYLPADCLFLITHAQSVIQAFKIRDTKLHEDPPGISGNLIEGRYYYDAFVLSAKADAVYAAVSIGSQTAAPTIAVNGGSATVTGSGTVKYTLDSADPRYAKTAFVYASPVPVPPGTVVKAYAQAEGKYASAVATATVPAA